MVATPVLVGPLTVSIKQTQKRSSSKFQILQAPKKSKAAKSLQGLGKEVIYLHTQAMDQHLALVLI